MQTPREICLKLLVSTFKNSSYSNIALDATLKRYNLLTDVDKRFISALYYGVIERAITLDAIITKYSSRPVDKLSDAVRQILRMGIYQLLYMNSVPDSAAVNESVILTKDNKNPAVSGFVNALLRSFIRDDKKLPLNGVKLHDLSVQYSCPEWLVKMWLDNYGEMIAVSMMSSSLGKPPVTARLNTTRFAEEDIINTLTDEGVSVRKIERVDNCIELYNVGSVEKLTAYQQGMLHIQDISCQICCEELDPQAGETILDMCSAPGGKAFTIAERMNNQGRVLAFDLHQKRADLIASGAKRLALDIISASANDAKAFNSEMPVADRVLCDVPCSGLGVIRRKPEIKYGNKEQFDRLPEVQYDILSTSSTYVKAGGILVYSTCTVNRQENDEVCAKFLSEHTDFEPVKLNGFTDYKVTITPDMFNSDGFYIAKFRRKG